MPGVSGNMVKGYIDEGYDYMLESFDLEAKNAVAPLIYKQKKIDLEGWQQTTTINSGKWRKTEQTEGFVPSQPVDGYTVYARIWTYTQAASFTNDAVKDIVKMKNLLKDIAGGWGDTAVETSEDFYALPFNNGGLTAGHFIFNGTVPSGAWTDGSGNKLYDSTNFFPLTGGTKHDSKGGNSYYNGFGLNLTPSNLKTIYIHGKANNNKRENDTQFNLRLDTLLVPTNLTLTADEVMNSVLTAYESTNTRNPLSGRLRIQEWSYLTDSDAWFVGLAKKGITMLERQEPTFDFFQDKLNRAWWAVAEMRMGVMIHNWRYWLASNMSTS